MLKMMIYFKVPSQMTTFLDNAPTILFLFIHLFIQLFTQQLENINGYLNVWPMNAKVKIVSEVY